MATADINHTLTTVEKTTEPAVHPEKSKLVFGKYFTDHMLEINWSAAKGWEAPKIAPRKPFTLDPACSVFHYAIECFEGMKAYRGRDGKVRLFRPMMNMERMRRSAIRVGLPPFNPTELLECIKQLVTVESNWIPEGEGFSLYIRPCYISTQATVGVTLPTQAKLFVICCPVGPYYASGWKPVKLLCSDQEKFCRAWPGGTGSFKVGGNYALTLLAQKEAQEKGYAQVLWLFGEQGRVTEVGTMNFFAFWKNEQGEKELITCPITDMILPGVTRDSILAIARKMGDIKVSERDYTIHDIIKAIKEGRMLEAFGTGTAAVVSPVNGLCYEGQDYSIPLDPHNPKSAIGPLTKKLYDTIQELEYGSEPHEWMITI